jgi:hypothetical protein
MARGMDQEGNAMEQRRNSSAEGLGSGRAIAEAHRREVKSARRRREWFQRFGGAGVKPCEIRFFGTFTSDST